MKIYFAEEVETVLKGCKNNEASGVDSLANEF